jgi:GNAT superfamily N-acetyltransferase
MNESVQVRHASPADWADIVGANAALAAESEHRELDRRLLEPGVRAVLADVAKGVYYVAQSEGAFAGQTLITFEWSDWRNGWFWWIQSVYVMPNFRRRGVFRALHTHIRDAARAQRNVCGLRLYVERENTTARGTYIALGMQETGYLLLEEDWSKPHPE